MTTGRRAGWLALICLASSAVAVAQAYSPLVEIAVTMPDGQTKTLTAPESGLAVTTLGGVEYGFRPTLVDDKPWTHVIVTIFKMASQTQVTQELGQVDLRTGGTAGTSKTAPSFKVAVTKVSPPAA
jgi:hypothetical protein